MNGYMKQHYTKHHIDDTQHNKHDQSEITHCEEHTTTRQRATWDSWQMTSWMSPTGYHATWGRSFVRRKSHFEFEYELCRRTQCLNLLWRSSLIKLALGSSTQSSSLTKLQASISTGAPGSCRRTFSDELISDASDVKRWFVLTCCPQNPKPLNQH